MGASLLKSSKSGAFPLKGVTFGTLAPNSHFRASKDAELGNVQHFFLQKFPNGTSGSSSREPALL